MKSRSTIAGMRDWCKFMLMGMKGRVEVMRRRFSGVLSESELKALDELEMMLDRVLNEWTPSLLKGGEKSV